MPLSGNVVGTGNATKADAKAQKVMGKAFEIICARMDQTAPNPFDLLVLAEAFLANVKSGNLQMPVAPTTSTPVAMLGAGSSNDAPNPSIEEELGTELLKIASTESEARRLLSLIRTVNNGGPGLQGIVMTIAEDIKNNTERILNNGSRYQLKSKVDAEQIAEAYATLVYDFTEEICGFVTSGNTPAAAVAEARKKLNEKATPAPTVNQDDKYLDILERVSTIRVNLPGTTFEQHLRVVLDKFQKASVAFADRLKHHSGVEYQDGEPIVKYVDDAIKSLRPATPLPANSTELDAIGKKVGENRNGENDADFGRRLVGKVNGMVNSVNALDKDVERAAAIYRANPGTPRPADGVTPVGILEAVIRHLQDTTPKLVSKAGGQRVVVLPATTTS